MADYSAVCPREKEMRTFTGDEVLTDTGVVLAVGDCPDCGTIITEVVVSP